MTQYLSIELKVPFFHTYSANINVAIFCLFFRIYAISTESVRPEKIKKVPGRLKIIAQTTNALRLSFQNLMLR